METMCGTKGRLMVCALCLALTLTGCGNAAAQGTGGDGAYAGNISETTGTSLAASGAEAPALPSVSETMTALEDADAYLELMPLSRENLISQLVYDGFSAEEAEAAADACGADWNEQAVRQAKSYLDTMEFTYEELVDQLEYDKFTPEQAAYGADNCGAAW